MSGGKEELGQKYKESHQHISARILGKKKKKRPEQHKVMEREPQASVTKRSLVSFRVFSVAYQGDDGDGRDATVGAWCPF